MFGNDIVCSFFFFFKFVYNMLVYAYTNGRGEIGFKTN